MYKIACIMGKSATGKDHIYKALLEDRELNMKNVVMYTTRPIRDGEKDGVEYNFTDDAVADRMEKDGKIIEMRTYNTVYGPWKYFTADDGQIDLEEGRYLVIGTLEAYLQYVKYYGNEVVLPIYIEVEDGVRLTRALSRERQQSNPKYKEMCRRFIADCDDFSEEKLNAANVQVRFNNDTTLEECIANVKKYILTKM